MNEKSGAASVLLPHILSECQISQNTLQGVLIKHESTNRPSCCNGENSHKGCLRAEMVIFKAWRISLNFAFYKINVNRTKFHFQALLHKKKLPGGKICHA